MGCPRAQVAGTVAGEELGARSTLSLSPSVSPGDPFGDGLSDCVGTSFGLADVKFVPISSVDWWLKMAARRNLMLVETMAGWRTELWGGWAESFEEIFPGVMN